MGMEHSREVYKDVVGVKRLSKVDHGGKVEAWWNKMEE